MSEDPGANSANEEKTFSRQVGAQAARKLKAQRQSTKSIWFGLGASGLIGWSVTIPTLLGAALGIWIDKHYPSSLSWTLMMLALGLLIGCGNAWRWVHSEYTQIQDDKDE